MTNPPIVLVPGCWLGAWAWDEVAAALRADGPDVTAITLPSLDPAADRAEVSFAGFPATPRPTAHPNGSPRWCTSTPVPARAR